MRISEFQDNAKAPGKTDKDKSSGEKTVSSQPKIAPPGPKPPAPKPPFGMPVLPVAINIKPVTPKVLETVKKTDEEE